MENNIYYYQSGNRVITFKDGKKLSRHHLFEYVLNNYEVTLHDPEDDSALFIDLIQYMKNILSVYKIKKGKRKNVYVDEFGIKYSDSSLSKLHFPLIPIKICVNLIRSIKHEN